MKKYFSKNSPFAYIDVYIIERCNLRCPYCYNARAHAGREMTTDTYSKVAELVNSCPFEPVPNLLGGEPMLKRDLNVVLDMLRSTKAKRIELTTNGTVPIFRIDNFEKLKLIFSYHDGVVNRDRFIANVNSAIDIGVDFQITLCINNNPGTIRWFIERYPLERLDFNLISIDSPELDNFLYTFDVNGKMLNERLIYKLKLNRFKNWECHRCWFNIDIDGQLRNGCDNRPTTFTDSVKCTCDSCDGGLPALSSFKAYF